MDVQAGEHELICQNLGTHVGDTVQLGSFGDFGGNRQPLLHRVLEDALYLLLARVLFHGVKQIWQPVNFVEPNGIPAGASGRRWLQLRRDGGRTQALPKSCRTP